MTVAKLHVQGPAFLPSGIFKPAYLVTLSGTPLSNAHSAEPASHPLLASDSGSIFIEEHSLEIYKSAENFSTPPKETADWVINVTLAVRSAQAGHSPVITVSIPELHVSSGALKVSNIPASTSDATFVTAKFNIPDHIPERWYPHNLGTPKLYNFTVTLALSNDRSAPAASFNLTSGFRTVEIVQTPYSQEEIDSRGITPGDQWHFNVNGQPFYTMGTNIIPFDPFYARMTSEQVRWVLESAVKSGQNMVIAISTLALIITDRVCSFECGEEVSTSLPTSSLEDTISIPHAMNLGSSPGLSLSSPIRCTLLTTSSWNPSIPRCARTCGGSINTLAMQNGPAEMRLKELS